jgi:pSer/pThr/pTyr-binding forkhead associated (FHA) protein
LDHPSISRYHAIIQHKKDGSVHLFDLSSSHGTFLNKEQVRPRDYYRIWLGDQIRFGASTRVHILASSNEKVWHIEDKIVLDHVYFIFFRISAFPFLSK